MMKNPLPDKDCEAPQHPYLTEEFFSRYLLVIFNGNFLKSESQIAIQIFAIHTILYQLLNALRLSLDTRAENPLSHPAHQALIRIALCSNMGGIHAFTTVIGRCITTARVLYYKAPGRSFPDNAKCVRPTVPRRIIVLTYR